MKRYVFEASAFLFLFKYMNNYTCISFGRTLIIIKNIEQENGKLFRIHKLEIENQWLSEGKYTKLGFFCFIELIYQINSLL